MGHVRDVTLSIVIIIDAMYYDCTYSLSDESSGVV
jgi:hypothetical protein